MTPPRGGRLGWLTALRFVAALGVVICHLAVALHARGTIHSALVFWQFGVDFFFVLSGFVLTWSRRRGRSAARFYWLRFARVWPLHALVMCLMFVLGARAPVGEVVAQVLLLHQWNPGAMYTEGLNGVSWTLSVEAFFYLLFPFLLIGMSRCGTRVVVAVPVVGWIIWLGVIVAAGCLPSPLAEWVSFSNPAVRLPQFLAGVAVAMVLERRGALAGRSWVRVWQWSSGVALVLTLWVYVATGGGHIEVWTWVVTPVMVWVVASFAMAGVTCGDEPPHWFVRLGEWSFALYLVHRGLVYVRFFPRVQDWPAWVSAPTAIVLALIVAGVIHECFEKPVERWLRGRGPSSVRSTNLRG